MNDYFLYPFILTPFDPGFSISNGRLFPVPNYCRKNCSSETCHNFYLQNCSSVGIVKCPHGFAVDVFKLGEQKIIFTCLNVDRFSDKEAITGIISENDFIPQIPYASYIQTKSSLISLFEKMTHMAKREEMAISQLRAKEKENYDASKVAAKYIHDIKHPLAALTFTTKRILAKQLFDRSDSSVLKSYVESIYTFSKRCLFLLTLYSFYHASDFSFLEKKSPTHVCQVFDSVARILDFKGEYKRMNIVYSGTVYDTCLVNNYIDLLAFLLLDNAINFSQNDEKIHVFFESNQESLKIVIKSYSRRPANNDIPHLKERGFHSNNYLSGVGMGLYFADLICIYNDISLEIIVGDNINKDSFGIEYSDFIVRLDFSNALLTES